MFGMNKFYELESRIKMLESEISILKYESKTMVTSEETERTSQGYWIEGATEIKISHAIRLIIGYLGISLRKKPAETIFVENKNAGKKEK